jgi:hypothetical protein
MKKLLSFTLIIFCGLSVFGQSEKSKTQTATPDSAKNKTEVAASVLSPITDEEYSVYTAVLGKTREMFVIRDKTNMDKESKNIEKYSVGVFFKELVPDTIEDFLAKNKENAQIEKKFPTNIPYTLISIEQLKEFFAYEYDGKMDWEAFYTKYPKSGGVFTFSRVGFSQDGKQALIFITNWCKTLCGTGEYYFLKKENGEWKVSNKHMVWIS